MHLWCSCGINWKASCKNQEASLIRVAFVAEMWRSNGSGFHNACDFFLTGGFKQEGRECDSDRYKEGCTDLVSFDSFSLILQACLLSPLHLLLLFLVSLQIEFLVPGLVLEAYSISCSPGNAFQGILAWTQCLWSCQKYTPAYEHRDMKKPLASISFLLNMALSGGVTPIDSIVTAATAHLDLI